ncbi:MAG: DUF86 domain-containing protein [Verrucomicrobia bacterium]|nr:DUF86 domain-containing protein [Verrucomicrobiota bacterium]
MDDEVAKWLFDALQASKHIRNFVKGKSYEDYRSDVLLMSGVERQFEVIGEALKRVRDRDDVFIGEIRGWRGAISFRNILAHGYDEIDDELVWGIIEDDLPLLIEDIEIRLK